MDEAGGKTKLENAQIIRDGLLALREKIDVLVDETVGINIPNAKNTDHDICLTCTFKTWEDLDAYATHPEHVKVAQYIGKCKEARSAVDYEEQLRDSGGSVVQPRFALVQKFSQTPKLKRTPLGVSVCYFLAITGL